MNVRQLFSHGVLAALAAGALVAPVLLLAPPAEALQCDEEGPFVDVPSEHVFCAEIDWLADAGVSEGYGDDTFRPTLVVSRQAMAAFLARLGGPPELPDCAAAPFDDVPTDHPFCAEIAWAATAGISEGRGDGTFGPADPVTRQAMAAFLARLGRDLPLGDCTRAAFRDVPGGHTFCAAVRWLVQQDITGGYGDGTFRPSAPVTRQAMAAFLFRLAPVLAGNLPCAGTTIPQRECDALAEFYTATGGPGWVTNTGWGTAVDPCVGWYNVDCRGGHVVGIFLDSNNLTGAIPPEIGDLPGLTNLSLAGNDLGGAVPARIGSLGLVKSLNLTNNELTSVAVEIADLGSATVIGLSGNELTGVPDSIGALTGLEQLYLHSNQLTGLPDSLGGLTGLTTLHLENNLLHGDISGWAVPLSSGATGLTTLVLGDGGFGNNCLEVPDGPPATVAWLDALDPGWDVCLGP